jgi:ankyrin repeat protein
MARLLLSDEYDADPLATSKTGDTPLHVAARWGYSALVELFITRHHATFCDDDDDDDEDNVGGSRASGTDIDEPNNVGYGPLRMAVRFGHYDAAKALLDAGANPRRKGTRR